jgi:hypothetical protein
METKLANYTNSRIENWYRNAKLDYGVTGHGKVRFGENEVFIDYTENGVEKTWSMAFYPEYILNNGISYIFDVWMDEAR